MQFAMIDMHKKIGCDDFKKKTQVIIYQNVKHNLE